MWFKPRVFSTLSLLIRAACLRPIISETGRTLVTSRARLFAVFRSTYTDDVDPVEVGRYQLETTAAWFDRAMDARDARPRASMPQEFGLDPDEIRGRLARYRARFGLP